MRGDELWCERGGTDRFRFGTVRRRPLSARPGPASPRMVLGLVDGLHDAGAALVHGDRLLAAANEERFTRRKLQGGMPTLSLHAVLRAAQVKPEQVEAIAVGGIATPTGLTRLVRPLQRLYAPSGGLVFTRAWHPIDRLGDLARYQLGFTRSASTSSTGRAEGRLARVAIQRQLPPRLRHLPLHFVDHHLAHAESAWRTAGAGDWLVVTADAHGDGRSLTISEGREGRRDGGERRELQQLFACDATTSLGAFYSYVTATLGFRPGRHEGKVLGLAARGDPGRVERAFPFRWDGTRLHYEGRWGLRGMRDLEPLQQANRDDVAAWLQAGTADVLLALIRTFLELSKLRRVALAGGVFANVAINGRLAAEPGVEALHVFPHMGDGGLAAGAAFHVVDRTPAPLSTACLGPDMDAGANLASSSQWPKRWTWTRRPDPDSALLDDLAQGLPVVRCTGRMEMGPRALGHRSVLAPAADGSITTRLNHALDRDDFMPFGPIVAVEAAAACFEGLEIAASATRFMTVALAATEMFRRLCPAAVHLDGTARPQVVSASDDAELHALLRAYQQRTHQPGLINTSFNRHEEPIVASASDALHAFARSGLPTLRLGPWIVRDPASLWRRDA